MKLKENVIMCGLNIGMRQFLIIAELIYNNHNQELVITSALDGEHSAGSLHYYGMAVDIRTYYFNETEKRNVMQS